MGIEWTFVCRSCRQHAWLGSMKPAKWGGFQAGNHQVIELMSIHAGCEWALIRDDTSTDTPWLDTTQESPSQPSIWREDLRSRSLWQPPAHRSGMACAWCATGDSRTSQGVPISPGLWFCSNACRDQFAMAPQLIWREAPPLPANAQLLIACPACQQQQIWAMLSTPDHAAEAVAEWLIEHSYRAEAGAGLAAPGCWLRTALILPAILDQ